MQIRPPTLADKDVVLTFRREFMAKEPVLHGGNELNAFSDDGFIGWLNYINSEAGFKLFEYHKVADSTFIALLDNKVVGIVHLRHTLNEALLEVGGHIGYSTHPDYYGRGIATQMLQFGLAELKRLGVSRVLVTCTADNTASRRVIEKCGGVLKNTVIKGGKHYLRFWI